MVKNGWCNGWTDYKVIGLLQTVAAICEAANEFRRGNSRGAIYTPLLVRRGGCGINKKSAKPTLAPQTGRSLTDHVLKMHSETFCVSDLPVRSFKEASRHFLEVASSPPHEEHLSKLSF